MLRLSYARNFFALVCLFSLSCYDVNSSSAAIPTENQPQFTVGSGCKIYYNQSASQFKLNSVLAVNANSRRATCIIRIATSTQKQYRLVPLAFKGQVKQAPATVAISSILIGDQPTRVVYQSPSSGSFINFDLTKQILPTNYTSNGKSVLGINIVLATSGGEAQLTDVRFAIQQK